MTFKKKEFVQFRSLNLGEKFLYEDIYWVKVKKGVANINCMDLSNGLSSRIDPKTIVKRVNIIPTEGNTKKEIQSPQEEIIIVCKSGSVVPVSKKKN